LRVLKQRAFVVKFPFTTWKAPGMELVQFFNDDEVLFIFSFMLCFDLGSVRFQKGELASSILLTATAIPEPSLAVTHSSLIPLKEQ
jgi:hypothetical protein